MPACAETHPLLRIGGVRHLLIVGLLKFVQGDELFWLCRLTGAWMMSHGFLRRRRWMMNDRISPAQYIRLDLDCQARAWLQGPLPGC